MSAADGRITFDTKINTKGIKDGMKGAEAQVREGSKEICTHFDSIGNSLKKLGAMIGSVFAIRELVRFGKEAIQLASDLQEVQNVVDVTFGNMSEAVNEFARNAIEQFGLSELSAKQYSSTMGAMLKSMGFSTKQAAEMSMTLTGLAGDLASFYNLSGDEAFAKLRSGISGETEPLKQLGINLSVANLEQYALAQGIGKTYSAMTQQEQAMLRYNYLLSVTSDAQGDFARTADSWANQTRILTEQFNMLKASVGQGLINVFTPVLKVINTVLSGLQRLASAFQQVTALIFGNSRQVTASAPASDLQEVADGYNAAADGAEGLAKGTQAAGKAAKKAGEEAKKSLASFDEINKLTAPETGDSSTAAGSGGIGSIGGTGAAGLSIPAFESEPIEDTVSPQIQAIVDKIMALIEPLRDIDFTRLKESLANLGSSFMELGGFVFDGLEWVWFNILVPLAQWTIEEAVPAALDLFSEALDLLRKVAEDLRPLAEWLWDSFLKPIAEWTGGVIVDTLEMLADALTKIGDWISKHSKAVETFAIIVGSFAAAWELVNIAITVWNAISGIATAMTTAFGGAVAFLTSPIALVTLAIGALIAIVVLLVRNWDTVKEVAAKVWASVTKTWEKAAAWFREHVTEPISNFFRNMGDAVKNVWNNIVDAVSDAVNKIMSWFGKIGSGSASFSVSAGAGTYDNSAAAVPSAYSVGNAAVPFLAKGAVIPPKSPFVAVLGDQRSGNNIEAPESLIRKIVREETRGMSSRRVEELLERLISTVEGIEVGDETIGRAAARYNRVAERARGY